MLKSYFDLRFEVNKKPDKSRYANGNDIRLVSLAPFALFSNFKLTTSSGKHLEDISHSHIVSLMYKLITTAKDSDHLSIGFDRSRGRRKQELTNNKKLKNKYRVRFMLRDVFGSAEYHEKTIYCVGYKVTFTRNKDDAVIDKAAGIADARIEINHIHWQVARYTPSTQQQRVLSNQILNKTPTELRYVERSDFMKQVKNQNIWNFELGSHENVKVFIWILIDFQQKDRQDSQNLNNDTFCRLPVVSAQCFIGAEKYPDAGILINYDVDDYRQAFSQIKEAFRASTREDILQL